MRRGETYLAAGEVLASSQLQGLLLVGQPPDDAQRKTRECRRRVGYNPVEPTGAFA